MTRSKLRDSTYLIIDFECIAVKVALDNEDGYIL